MFTYSDTTPPFIIACDLSNAKFIGEDNVTSQNGGISADVLFPINSIWKDRSLLYDTVKIYSARTGWTCCLKNLYKILCNCHKKTDSNRNYSQGSINKGCTWVINMKSSKYSDSLRGGTHRNGKVKRVPVFEDNVPVTITKNSCLEHGGSCAPSTQQQIVQRSRAGDYIKGISALSFFQLCNTLQTTGKLKFSVIKDALQQQFPSNKNVTKNHVWNMRIKVKSMLPSMHTTQSFNDFQALCNTSNVKPGLDNTPLSDDDVAVIAKEVWEEIMCNDPNEDAIVTFKEYMDLLKKSNKGFLYELFHDTRGKCTGCVWQTSIMRDNFERFGGFIALDAMKREINSLLWPYMAITMYNELEMICLACEAIVITERKEAYKALINFVCDEKHSSRLHKDVSVLTADGAVNQNIVTHDFLLPNAHFMADQWHMFDSVLPKRFGDVHFQSIKDELRKMCNAKSEEEHTRTFNAAMSVLQSRLNRTEKPEDELIKCRNERSSYAHYILSTVKGSKGRHGSSLAESNHSSVLIFLNDGERQLSVYKENPHTLVKDLFQRQAVHINKFNQELYNQKIRLDTEKQRFNGSTHKALVSAIDCLCLNSYEKFKSRVSRLSEYEMVEISDNHRVVKSKKYVSATPKHCYRSGNDGHFSCQSCEGSIAFQEQCEHSLMSNDEIFIESHFENRHLRRDVCHGSYSSSDDISESSYSNDDTQTQEFGSNHNEDDDSTSSVFEFSQDQADRYENEDIAQSKSNNSTKALSFSEVRDIFDEILSHYDKCPTNVKFALGSIAISLKNMSQSDGKDNGLFDKEPTLLDDNELSTMMTELIHAHKNSFLPSQNAFIPSSKRSNDSRKSSHSNHSNKKRLKPMREEHRKKSSNSTCSAKKSPSTLVAQINTKAIKQCSFCGSRESGDNFGNCKRRKELQNTAVEYPFCATEHGFDWLLRRFEHDQPFMTPNVVGNLLTNMSSAKGKHVYIHHVWSTNIHIGMSIRDMCFEISFLNKLGCVDSTRYQITGQCFNEILSNLNSLQSKRFVYDATKEDSNQNSLSQISRMNNLSQLSRSSVTMNHSYGNENMMMLHNRPLSQEHVIQFQSINEPYTIGRNINIHYPQQMSENNGRQSNISHMTNEFQM